MIGHALRPLVQPPFNLMLLGGIGFLLRRKRPRLARVLIVGSIGLLYALSTPLVATALLISLQPSSALDLASAPRNAAIVVLGGDLRPAAREFGGDTVSMLSLERVRYAAWVAKGTGLPVLTSGGVIKRGARPVGELMKAVLEREFGVAVRWSDDRSRDTDENARFSAELLARDGIRDVVLVTHAWHVPRARQAFERAGLAVTPAPTAFRAFDDLDVLDFVPYSRSLHDSSLAIHEWIGRAWYALR